MKKTTYFKNVTCLFIILILFMSTVSANTINKKKNSLPYLEDDLDPLVDIEITVEIQKIRAFDKNDRQLSIIPYSPKYFRSEYIDKESDPDFYVKIIINENEFTSDIWYDTKYIYDQPWLATLNVPDNEEFVDITIQLWDWNKNGDIMCDIGNKNDDVNLQYSIKTGHWTGDDQIKDLSGYGRLNGCDDGTIYKRDRDCELWFNIYQNDYDGDGIPYWTEMVDYETDPEIDNTGDDSDGDNIPIEWEWKWEYNPFQWEPHTTIDPEIDGLNNLEEYKTSQWDSDPFRKDIFTELDQMEEGSNGEKSVFPEGSKELLYTTWNRQNIVYHLDDGQMGGGGLIPFDKETYHDELEDFYWDYFLHGNSNNWRRGVFHYGVLIWKSAGVWGAVFGKNRFFIESKGHEEISDDFLFERDTVFASAYMHETGHTLGFHTIPGHNSWSKYPWQPGWWINRPYKSCMNYGYMYYTVDYSDGSRMPPDLDDWSRMDLTYFQRHWT